MKKNGSAPGMIENNWYLLRIALKAAPYYTTKVLIDGILHQLVVFIEHIYMISFIIDCIQYQRPFWHVLLFVGLVFVGVSLTHTWGNHVNTIVKPKALEKINRAARLALYEKAVAIDLKCYDDPEFYNDFVWAMGDVTDRIAKVMDTTMRFLGAIAGIAVTGGYILTADWLGIVMAAVSFVLTLVFGARLNKLQFKLDSRLKPLQRKRDYINRVFFLGDYTKEVRLSGVKEKLYEDFSASNDDIRQAVEEDTKKMPWYFVLIDFVCNTFIFNGIYILYLMFLAVVKGAFSLGTMVALYNSSQSLTNCMQDLAKVLPEFQQHSLYIDKVRGFLNYDVSIVSGEDAKQPPAQTKDLQMEHVSFSYTPDGPAILRDISLTIRKGEKIAFVGYNGAGKTTLVKLLMRLYDPSGGRIVYGGEDIRDYDVDAYRKMIGTVFQDYQLFAATLGENVVMDDVPCQTEPVEQALRRSGFGERLASLPQGLSTPITKEFEESGTNLSGGESQKVAISRALYKEAPLIILDEPSSALDPIAEYNLNSTMRSLTSEQTVLFISHRLSTTKMADRIYMLENGRIIEQGNHDQLMELDGKYAVMFHLQARRYR